MSSCTSFPPELWRQTLHNLREWKSQDELVYLWTTLRHVSRHFKAEVEDIFRTEHLPKTCLHFHPNAGVSPSARRPHRRWAVGNHGSPQYTCRFEFAATSTADPGRAVFSICARDTNDEMVNASFKSFLFESSMKRLGEGTYASRRDSVKVSKSTAGLALVQIRGSLHDCSIPSLTVDWVKHEISFDWKRLVTRFFGEKRMMDWILEGASAGDTEIAPEKAETRPLDHEPSLAFSLSKLSPNLQAVGRQDVETMQSNWTDSQARIHRTVGLLDPVGTWIAVVGFTHSSEDVAILDYRLRRKADQEAIFTDDGALDETKIKAVVETNQIDTVAVDRDDDIRAMTCDSCRQTNTDCQPEHEQRHPSFSLPDFPHSMGLPSFQAYDQLKNFDFDSFLHDDALNRRAPCTACVANNLECEYTLVKFSRAMRHSTSGRQRPGFFYMDLMLMNHPYQRLIMSVDATVQNAQSSQASQPASSLSAQNGPHSTSLYDP